MTLIIFSAVKNEVTVKKYCFKKAFLQQHLRKSILF